MICVAVFTVGSLLCGLARSLGVADLSSASCRASAAAAWRRASRRSSPTPFRREKRAQAFALYGIAVDRRAGDRPDARRLDHRQLLLALDLLHQRAGRHHVARSWCSGCWSSPRCSSGNAASACAGGLKVDWHRLRPGRALRSAASEIVLDKGQREDWFRSSFIVTFARRSRRVALVFCVPGS